MILFWLSGVVFCFIRGWDDGFIVDEFDIFDDFCLVFCEFFFFWLCMILFGGCGCIDGIELGMVGIFVFICWVVFVIFFLVGDIGCCLGMIGCVNVCCVVLIVFMGWVFEFWFFVVGIIVCVLLIGLLFGLYICLFCKYCLFFKSLIELGFMSLLFIVIFFNGLILYVILEGVILIW